MIIIILDKPILSRNKTEGRHWSVKNRYTQEWEWLIKSKGKLPKAKGKMNLQITSFRKKKLDYDNLVGGCKGLIDAIKRLGGILNDSPDLVTLKIDQEKIRKPDKQRTEIKISEDEL